MTTFVDTSAWYALLDGGDPHHDAAARHWGDLLSTESVVTHSYVLVETLALVQARLGVAAVETFVNELSAPAEVVRIDRELHQRAITALLAARRRRISFVDWTSFEVMRQRGIGTAFVFDDDFAAQGFTPVP